MHEAVNTNKDILVDFWISKLLKKAISHSHHLALTWIPLFLSWQNKMIQQDRQEKERNNAKNAVEENVYYYRHKLEGSYQTFLNAQVMDLLPDNTLLLPVESDTQQSIQLTATVINSSWFIHSVRWMFSCFRSSFLIAKSLKAIFGSCINETKLSFI